jgi:hypothetical protein
VIESYWKSKIRNSINVSVPDSNSTLKSATLTPTHAKIETDTIRTTRSSNEDKT